VDKKLYTDFRAGGAGAWSNNTCMLTGKNGDSDHGTYVQAEYFRPGHFGILLVSVLQHRSYQCIN